MKLKEKLKVLSLTTKWINKQLIRSTEMSSALTTQWKDEHEEAQHRDRQHAGWWRWMEEMRCHSGMSRESSVSGFASDVLRHRSQIYHWRSSAGNHYNGCYWSSKIHFTKWKLFWLYKFPVRTVTSMQWPLSSIPG